MTNGYIQVHNVVSYAIGNRVYFKIPESNNLNELGNGGVKNAENELYVDVDTVILCTGYKIDLNWIQHPSIISNSDEEGDHRISSNSSNNNKSNNNDGGDTYDPYHTITMEKMAKERSKNPNLGIIDGLFFVGKMSTSNIE